jgi:hypothetical protein
MSKKPISALVTYHNSIVQRAIGLLMGALDSHMSQHYSPHNEAESLLNAEAGLGIKSKSARKSILFVSHNRTVGGYIQLPIKQHAECELVVCCLDTW